jgi:hypothetical protein
MWECKNLKEAGQAHGARTPATAFPKFDISSHRFEISTGHSVRPFGSAWNTLSLVNHQYRGRNSCTFATTVFSGSLIEDPACKREMNQENFHQEP